MTEVSHHDASALDAMVEKILKGGEITEEEAALCMREMPLDALCEAAHRVTERCAVKTADLCSISNVKSGRCTEDCKWCAQSRLYATAVDEYPLKDAATCVREARAAKLQGITSFSLVASGRRLSRRDFDELLKIIDAIKSEVGIDVCVSLGLSDRRMMQDLKARGVHRYHCNLESSHEFFPTVCTSHGTEDKLRTLQYAKEAGIKICSGGIIGMGESREDRLRMGLELRDLKTDSVPVNVLNPIKGTPLENMPPLEDDEILRTVAVYRLIMPRVYLRFAGGRINMSRELQERCLYAGVNAAITGDMLTTLGCGTESDRKMFLAAGYDLAVSDSEIRFRKEG